jgi:2-methylisocitrate lyase-like PEP mutase family enzyme
MAGFFLVVRNSAAVIMQGMTQREKAILFRDLHHGPRILVLPNVWDVATARIFEIAGFPAIGTTSAGVAASLGYPDGGIISRDQMLEVVARVVAAVDVPVTADVEAGYGDPVATAKAVVATGAIGMNLEDVLPDNTLADLDTQTAILREIKAANLPLVVNARTDVYLAGIGDPATRFERTVERLNAYREAGADCLFAPGIRDPETIAALTREVRGPLNILAVAGSPATGDLERMGVARVSVGSGPSRAALGLVRRIAMELREHGTYAAMTGDQVPYDELNQILRGASS